VRLLPSRTRSSLESGAERTRILSGFRLWNHVRQGVADGAECRYSGGVAKDALLSLNFVTASGPCVLERAVASAGRQTKL